MNMFLRDTPDRTAIHNEDFISIAISSYNRHDRLDNLINSIHRHADMPFEIVVSDDGGNLYGDYGFINRFKDRISHLSLNLGKNKGLHVNANSAVSLTRSKYVVLFTDDAEVLAPFMRMTVDLLKTVPHAGPIFLADSFNKDGELSGFDNGGVICCQSPTGMHYAAVCFHGGSWAMGFRKDYWFEVGGYSEDDIYGDMPFLNKGWRQGYFAIIPEGPPRARDTDKDVHGHAQDSTCRFVQGGYANYPKIFRWNDQDGRDNDRSQQCSQRNHMGRAEDFNDFDQHSWHKYIQDVTRSGKLDIELLENKYHKRFIDSIKRDALPRYF